MCKLFGGIPLVFLCRIYLNPCIVVLNSSAYQSHWVPLNCGKYVLELFTNHFFRISLNHCISRLEFVFILVSNNAETISLAQFLSMSTEVLSSLIMAKKGLEKVA